MSYIFPKGFLKIEGEPCNNCNKISLYELNVSKQDIRCNKIFCVSCEICTECEKEISNPNNLCKKCYCSICGQEYYSVMMHVDFDSMNEVNKDECRKHHINDCTTRKQKELDMFNGLANMDIN